MATITMLTDFGVKDEYVGVMKGVIRRIAPGAHIVDITHQINPQNLIEAAFMLPAYYAYFPRGSIHMVVVDPGVGSRRSIVAAKIDGMFFLAPDNGVLTLILERQTPTQMVRVTATRYFLDPISSTFHGRDIFAPVAAHLAGGHVVLPDLGSSITQQEVVRLKLPSVKIKSPGHLVASIVAIDRFGNLITNIESSRLNSLLEEKTPECLRVSLCNKEIKALSTSYSDVVSGGPLVLAGSRGYIEIAVKNGSAQIYFQASIGDGVEITFL